MDPLEALLNDHTALSIVKGQFVEPAIKGLASKGLIDPQDVGTMVEAAMIGVKFYARLMAAGKAAH